MKFLYETIVNALMFYFFLNVFNGIKIAGAGNNLMINILAGLIFGFMVASIPSILKFMKIPVNSGSTFLMALIVIFIFMFILQQQVAGLGNINPTLIDLGFNGGKLKFGSVQTMVVATVTISLAVLGLQTLSKQGGKK